MPFIGYLYVVEIETFDALLVRIIPSYREMLEPKCSRGVAASPRSTSAMRMQPPTAPGHRCNKTAAFYPTAPCSVQPIAKTGLVAQGGAFLLSSRVKRTKRWPASCPPAKWYYVGMIRIFKAVQRNRLPTSLLLPTPWLTAQNAINQKRMLANAHPKSNSLSHRTPPPRYKTNLGRLSNILSSRPKPSTRHDRH